MRDNIFWAMFGFLIGIFFLTLTLENYERPNVWEDGGIIIHQGKSYKLQKFDLAGDKK